jgi:hypothetical protein
MISVFPSPGVAMAVADSDDLVRPVRLAAGLLEVDAVVGLRVLVATVSVRCRVFVL